MGAIVVDKLIAGVHYQTNTAPDGSGTDRSIYADMRLEDVSFNGAQLRIHNRTATPMYLLADASIKGTPLYTGAPYEVAYRNHATEIFYGGYTLMLDMPLLDDIGMGHDIARYELARRKNPIGIAHEIQLSSRHDGTPALAYGLFDRITVTDSQLKHSADSIIIAEYHTVDEGGWRHRVKWLLEPANPQNFWLIGQGRLDASTVVAY